MARRSAAACGAGSGVTTTTIPQLYVEGQLVGGCDITLDMYQTGELEPLLAKAAGDAAS